MSDFTEFMVETFTGRFVDTKLPKPEQICLEDIAHALSQTCRYGGHCREFYSVAEHAVVVSKRLERQGSPRVIQFAGLHHDDAEAYLGDIPRPMKGLLGQAYKLLTRRMDKAIWKAVLADDLPGPGDFHQPVVKAADNWALLLEAKHLLPSRGVNWVAAQKQAWGLEDQGRIVTPDYWQGGILPKDAELLFLERHKELTS